MNYLAYFSPIAFGGRYLPGDNFNSAFSVIGITAAFLLDF